MVLNPASRRLFPYLFFLGLLITIAGLVFSPPFVAKYVKHAESLSAGATSKVISYQLYSVTAGISMIMISIFLAGPRLGAFVLLPLVIVGLFLVDHVYVDKVFPENLFFTTSGFRKTWNILLGKELVLGDYHPRPSLSVNNREVLRARYPAIDTHFNLHSMEKTSADELVRAMDACGVEKIVNVQADPGDPAKYALEFRRKYPDRLIMFTRLNLHEIGKPDFPEGQIALLENAVRSGARGLKVIKSLGLTIRDASGNVVPVDDPRLDPIWEKAGELGIPVLMHTGDPSAFFDPIDRFNERYEELREFPDWSFHGPRYPDKATILAQRENLLKKHPRTIFIGAHMGDSAEDLSYLSGLLDRRPNFYVNISSRLPELGRQPFTARAFFLKYQDRILFGTDGGYALDPHGLWPAERYFRSYFTFLETRNEYFEYPLWGINKQGRWRIYGIDLPDIVLRKIYRKNAEKLLSLPPVRRTGTVSRGRQETEHVLPRHDL